jgi:hypothetical protein
MQHAACQIQSQLITFHTSCHLKLIKWQLFCFDPNSILLSGKCSGVFLDQSFFSIYTAQLKAVSDVFYT